MPLPTRCGSSASKPPASRSAEDVSAPHSPPAHGSPKNPPPPARSSRGQGQNLGPCRAEPPVDGRAAPNTAGPGEDRPLTASLLVRGRSCWCGGSRIRPSAVGLEDRPSREVAATTILALSFGGSWGTQVASSVASPARRETLDSHSEEVSSDCNRRPRPPYPAPARRTR